MRQVAAVVLFILAGSEVLPAQIQKRETAIIRAPRAMVRVMATSEGDVEIIGSDGVQYVSVMVLPDAAEAWADTAAKIMRLRSTTGTAVETHYTSPFLHATNYEGALALTRVIGGRAAGVTLSVMDSPEHVAINLTPARFAVLRKGLLDAARFARKMDKRPPPPPAEPGWAYNTEKPAQLLPDNPEPKYPDVLRESNVEGSVEVQFVVDNSGIPEVSTLKVLRSSHDLFTAAVRSVLPRLRYTPAEVGGRKVPQWVTKTFDFVLQ